MDFGRTFTYVFEDKQWVSKLVITVLMVFISAIPVLGLLTTCMVLGYITELVKNVRNGHPRPLPKWENYGDRAISGAYVLLAIVIYNLPTMLIGVFLYTFNNVLGASLFGGIAYVVIIFCALPVLFIYSAFAWTMLAIGLNRYADTGDNGVFYRFGKLFRTIQQNTSLTIQYILYSIACNLILLILGAIPCIGWIATPALYVPVQGFLIGEFGRQLGASDRSYRDSGKSKG